MKGTEAVLIGIDEVGRGPLAGPVVACCVAIPPNINTDNLHNDNHRKTLLATPDGEQIRYNDSKKLTPLQRKGIYRQIIANKQIVYHCAHQTNHQIDKLGIQRCIHLAMEEALKQTLKKLRGTPIKHVAVDYVSGIEPYLKAHLNNHTEITIAKKGDTKFLAVALASIIAKVERDELMTNLGETYPEYHFASNKGYGSKKHIHSIRNFGLSPVHRKTFQIKTLIPKHNQHPEGGTHEAK